MDVSNWYWQVLALVFDLICIFFIFLRNNMIVKDSSFNEMQC